MHPKYILILATALVLSGCSTVNQTVAFNEADFAPYESPGNAVIHGHAFVRMDNGRIRNAAGLNVYLVPLTPYTAERAKIMRGDDDPSPADPRMDKYVKTTVADVTGVFEFKGLPAGSYVVYCKIEWWSGRRRRNTSGDYYVVGEATLAPGENNHLVVTNSGE